MNEKDIIAKATKGVNLERILQFCLHINSHRIQITVISF